MSFRKLCGAMLAVSVLTACGTASDQTTAAAKCLKIALAEQALGGTSCADTSVLAFTGRDAPAVTCTHQNANEYICHATPGDPSFDFLHVGDHFYNVTYDGRTIVWQQTQ